MPSPDLSRRRIGASVLFAGAFAAMALLAPQAGSGSAPVECRELTCSTSLDVGRNPVRWSSPEAFYPNNEQVFAGLSTGRGPLAATRSTGAGRCKHRFRGQGITALVTACGAVADLRVRAVRPKGRALRLRVTYSASAAMDGPPPVPAGGSSLTSARLTPISRAHGR